MLDKLATGLADIFTKLSFGGKLGSIVVTIAIVLWIDTQMGFTYHYFTDRKIGEIERLNAVLRDNSIDSTTRANLYLQRVDVINKSRGIDTNLPFHISYSWLIGLLIVFSYQILVYGGT